MVSAEPHVHLAPPGAGRWRDEHADALAETVQPLELSPTTRRIITRWLSRWECSTVDAVLELIAAARAVGR